MNPTRAKSFQRLTGYDLRAMCWLLGRPSAERSARVARQISRLGDGPFYAVAAAALWYAAVPGADIFTRLLLAAFLIELPLYLLLKNLIRRPRPADAVESLSAFIRPSDRFSFPSGHTAAAFVFAATVAACFPLWAPLALVLAAAIGLSRVLLGVHFPSDIVAGAVLGVGCTVTALILLA
jgi:undecaprenyl-diphosphatase